MREGGGVVVGLHIDKYISYIYASVDLCLFLRAGKECLRCRRLS